MRTGSNVAAMIALTASILIARGGEAQVRASEAARVAQTVDGTTITIEYSRPVARGREGLFGRLVKWGQMWTPGANWATTLEVDRDVHVNGNAVPKGKYTIWMIPRQSEPWTVVISRKPRLFHTQKPTEADDLLRFDVEPLQATHAELLTWSFPAVASEGATARMQWGTISLPLRVTVEPTRPTVIDADKASRYIGTYSMTFEDGGPPFPISVEIFQADGRLRGRMDPGPPDGDPEFELFPAGNDRFHIGWYNDGKLFDVDAESIVVFSIVNGKATAYEFTFEDKAWARAQRTR